jgi:hypothetical protein
MEKEQMKESTSHLQKRVRLLEEHNRTLLEFGQECSKRLLRLEGEHGWEPPEIDPAAALSACTTALDEVSAITALNSANQDAAVGGADADAKSGTDADGADSRRPDITSLDHSSAVNYIYQVGLSARLHALASAAHLSVPQARWVMTQRADPVTRVVGHITHETRCTRAQVYKHRTKDLHDEFDKKIKEVMQPLHSRFHYFV